MLQARQGDVLIEQIEDFPQKEIFKTDETLLVQGEGRDHGHFIVGDVDIFENNDDSDIQTTHYLNIKQESKLKHLMISTGLFTNEHEEITIKPGKYRVIRQREYDPYLKVIRILQD